MNARGRSALVCKRPNAWKTGLHYAKNVLTLALIIALISTFISPHAAKFFTSASPQSALAAGSTSDGTSETEALDVTVTKTLAAQDDGTYKLSISFALSGEPTQEDSVASDDDAQRDVRDVVIPEDSTLQSDIQQDAATESDTSTAEANEDASADETAQTTDLNQFAASASQSSAQANTQSGGVIADGETDTIVNDTVSNEQDQPLETLLENSDTATKTFTVEINKENYINSEGSTSSDDTSGYELAMIAKLSDQVSVTEAKAIKNNSELGKIDMSAVSGTTEETDNKTWGIAVENNTVGCVALVDYGQTLDVDIILSATGNSSNLSAQLFAEEDLIFSVGGGSLNATGSTSDTFNPISLNFDDVQSSNNSSSSGESGESENNNGEGSTQTPEVNVDSNGIITATVQEDGWYTIGIAGGNGGNGASARLGSGIGGAGSAGSYVSIKIYISSGSRVEFHVGNNGGVGQYTYDRVFGLPINQVAHGGEGGSCGYILINNECVLIASAGSGGAGAYYNTSGSDCVSNRTTIDKSSVCFDVIDYLDKYKGNAGGDNARAAATDLTSFGCYVTTFNGEEVKDVSYGLRDANTPELGYFFQLEESSVYSCTVTWSDLTYLADSAQWDTSSHVYTATNNTSAGFATSTNGGTITATNTGNMPVYATFSATPSLSNLQTVNIAFSNNDDDVIEVDGTKSTSVIVSGTVTFDSTTTPTTVGTCKVTISKNAPTQKEAA